MTEIALIDIETERKLFEAFCNRGMRRDEAQAFLARAQSGQYVSPATRAGWASWQARALTAAEDIIKAAFANTSASAEISLDVRLGIGHPAKLLRAIQIDAATVLERLQEGTKEWEIVADIHRVCASALQLKPAAPAASPPPGDTAA